jgi:hypothetical protein
LLSFEIFKGLDMNAIRVHQRPWQEQPKTAAPVNVRIKPNTGNNADKQAETMKSL